ncbi:hypothetical protein [Nocardioides yefusunii]|uniref:Integral membrane protein n=1 Tax=Nocardioides yefusunii TaxID=2500546 RepID=A0ABW1QT19_9ACTN|nr:hypothetical protein [Nocardioides yefusunii]
MGAMRSVVSAVLVLLGLLLVAVSAPATWAREHLLDTDEWTRTVSPLIAQPPVQDVVSTALVDGVDPDRRLPDVARALLDRATDAAVATDTFASAWDSAVRISHEHLVETIREDGKGIDTSQGVVAIELAPLWEALLPRLDEAGIPGLDRLPSPEGTVVLDDSEKTARVLDLAGEVDAKAWPVAVVAVVALLLGVLFARRRGRTLVLVGIGLVLVAVVEWAAWTLLKDQWIDGGGDPAGEVLLVALTDSVESWLLPVGVTGVVVLLVGAVASALGRAARGRAEQEAALR